MVAIGLLHPVNRGNGDYIRCSDGIAEIAVLHAGVTGHGNDPTAAAGNTAGAAFTGSWHHPRSCPVSANGR
ncbi:hypothetical protein DXD72_04960 [Bifidobacterium bifidum]|nr:hypothetical protein DXD72_04960 [Bifidobacterium bifidum]